MMQPSPDSSDVVTDTDGLRHRMARDGNDAKRDRARELLDRPAGKARRHRGTKGGAEDGTGCARSGNADMIDRSATR